MGGKYSDTVNYLTILRIISNILICKMNKLFFTLGFLLLLGQISFSQPSSAKQPSPGKIKEMASSVQYFLDLLPDSLRSKAMYAFDSDERYNWHFVPRARKGACYKSMDDKQRQAAKDLMRAVLSEKGFAKTEAIMEMESVLKELEKRAPSDNWRDPENYYFTVFGTPSATAPWGWRIEGHHLSLNFSSLNSQVVSNTPAFLGSNPAVVPSGPQKGKQILKQEEDLARDLMRTFSPAQLKGIIVEDTAPKDIITGNSRKAILEANNGISMAKMTLIQKKKFIELLNLYLDNFESELAGNQMKKIKKAGLDKLKFAWAGSLEKGKGHYYRIQGPTLLIEYDNTQNDNNHVHTVVRDLTNDFGEDVLKKHYQQQEHGK
jgi:hypothetical protein